MNVSNAQPFSGGMGNHTPTQQGATPHIQVPVPATQVQGDGIYNSDEELARKHEVVPLKASRYVKEKESGHVYKWSPEFAQRSDLLDNYNPTLEELLKFGEDIAELHSWGYTVQNLYDAGVNPVNLERYGMDIKQLQLAPEPPSAPAPPTPPAPPK